MLKTFPNQEHRLAFLNDIAWANIMLGNYEEAQKNGSRALVIAEQNENKCCYADALNNMGWVYLSRAEYPMAFDSLTRACEIYEELDHPEGVAKVLDSMGSLYWKLSDYSKALDSMQKAHNIYEKLGDKAGIATMDNNIGVIHWEIKDFDKSLEFYLKSMEAYQEMGNEAGVANTLNNIAIIYHDWEKDGEALQYYERSLKIKEKLGLRQGTANTLNNIGEVYYDNKDYQLALEYLTRSLEIKESINDRKGAAGTLINIARCRRKSGRLQEALTSARRGLEGAEKIDVKSEKRDAYLELSEIYEALKDYPKALSYHKKYTELNNAIFNETNSKKITEIQTRFDMQKKEREIAMLRKDKQLQQLDLEKQKAFRYSLIIISLLVLILAVVIYTRFRLKVKTTRALRKEIEDHKKTSRELEQEHQKFKNTQAQLAHSEKMAGLGTLVAGVAHEINNPTNFAHASAYNLERDLKKLKAFLVELAGDEADEEILAAFDEKFNTLSKHLETLQEGTIRIKGIVEDLRTFSRLDETDIKHVKLLEGLETTYHLVRANYRDQVDFVCDFRADPEIECFPAELNQVYMNLMVNACQAVIQKQKRGKDETKGTLTIQTREEDEFAVIRFQDNGIGMSQEVQRKMFDPFFTTKPVGEGTGLGLSISFGIIEKHHGRVEVESEEGKGTVITLYLPLEILAPGTS